MTEKSLHIKPIAPNQKAPVDLLLLADSSQTQIDSYLKTGYCYIAELEAATVGAMVLDKVNASTLEIKNIAVSEAMQGKGIGKALLSFAEKVSREKGFKTLLIATGNSSLGQLALYQKEGFEMKKLEHNFFLKHYPEPIIENGIHCKHKIILEKSL